MEIFWHIDTSQQLLLGQLNILQEALWHKVQGIRGPVSEPVDSAAVQQAREVPEGGAQVGRGCVHGQHYVKLLFN